MIAAAALLGISGSALGVGSLQTDVEQLIRAKHMGGARVGVVVIDSKNGRVLADVRGDEGFMPASNMKLLTTGASMMVLGPEFAFKTELALDGDRLILRGSGDPALGDPEILKLNDPRLSPGDLITTLAGSVVKAGALQLSEIIIDDRVFDRQFLHPTWNPDNFEENYSAEISGLNFHANTLWVFPRPSPSGAGSLPLCDTEPAAPWLRVDTSKSKTVTKNKNSFWVARSGEGDCFFRNGKAVREPMLVDGVACNTFVLRGDVRTASSAPTPVNVRNAPSFFGNILATNIEAQGVKLTGSVTLPELPRGVRMARGDEQLAGGRVIAVVSTPLVEVITHCNVESQNLYAESLLKRMGHDVTHEPGSWSNGSAVLRMLISQELGPEAATATTIADGSGLSRDNRVTPMTLAKWLNTCANKPWGSQFVTSLATPGTGTLEKRFKGRKLTNEVRAKSGYINGVRSLSGYVTDPTTGDRLIFSILINELPNGSNDATTNARDLHEEIVDLLDNALEQQGNGRKLGG